MKNTLLLLVLITVFYGCSKDADDENSLLQEFKVTINIDSDYRFGRFTKSARAFLSDENGVILDSAELEVGKTTVLISSGDPGAVYDLSYMKYADLDILGEESYTLTTFSNIDQGDYTFAPRHYIENNDDEIFLDINNIGYPSEKTSPSPGNGTFGPENGGYYKFNGNLVSSPISDFYISFKSPNDQFERYFWKENVDEGSVFEVDFNTLPEMLNIVNVQVPDNKIYNFRLEGLVNGNEQNILHSIREGNYSNGRTFISIPLPSDIFESYLFDVSFGTETSKYFKTIRTATIPNSINAPELFFTVNGLSEANFEMTTNGEAVIYNVIFRGTNSNETVSVAHSIYGEIKPEISFSKQNLRLNIQLAYPELNGFENIGLGSVLLMNYSTIDSYKEIVKYKIQGEGNEIPENGYNEGIGKRFD